MEFLVTNFQPVDTKARQKGVSLDSFAGPVHVEWEGGADAAWAIAVSSIF
jgi:hypothetical protein